MPIVFHTFILPQKIYVGRLFYAPATVILKSVMVKKQSDIFSLRKIERFAVELSSSIQLSFEKRRAVLFVREARSTIARMRIAYKTLIKNLTQYRQVAHGTEALLDNFYIIDSALTEISERWRNKEILYIPQISDYEGRSQPRVYQIAKAFVRETGARINRDSVVAFLTAYQRAAPLSVRELDIFPDMLRFALVEEVLLIINSTLRVFGEIDEAERLFKRIIRFTDKRNVNFRLTVLTTAIAEQYKVIPAYFGFYLLQRIMQSGREHDLRVINKWLKLTMSRQGVNYARLCGTVTRTEREYTIIISNAVTSLRWLAQVRWDRVALELNAVDSMLSRDPSGVFLHLCDDTRTQYRRTIVRIADRTGIHDVEVAREAVRLARIARKPQEKGEDTSKIYQHVGYFLIDEGVEILERAVGYHPTILERFRRFVLKNAASFYFGLISFITLFSTLLLFVFGGSFEMSFFVIIPMLIAGLILSSEIAVSITHFVFTRLILPRLLPALDLAKGVGSSRRTVVVVPSLFRNKDSADSLLRRLEINFVANNDPDIFYALLMDFIDAPKAEMSDDELRVHEVIEGINKLNERYPSAIPRFSLFYRKRLWNAAEGIFMGWERKRGKLREFNQLLRGKPTSYVVDGGESAAKLGYVRYIITIDEDTELTGDGAVTLIRTIEHPLNRPVVDPVRRIVVRGYGIIEPHLALRFRSGAASFFARLFGNFPGIETYSSLVSDLHQDLFGESIFHGKGIYDIDTIEKTMEGRIPENTVLSHDLLEGLYARVGVTNEAHIFERFPANFCEYMKRMHRWIRGDWQIIGWIFSNRGSVFPAMGKWKIADNLRRSLLPVAAFVAVIFVLFSPANTYIWSIAALCAVSAGQLVPALIRVITVTMTFRRKVTFSYRIETIIFEFAAALMKTFLLGIFVLHSTIITLDAVIRSMWRLFVSKRKLLEWQTAYEAVSYVGGGIMSFIGFMWRSVAIALIFVYISFNSGAAIDELAVAWTFSWVFAPFIALFISYRFARDYKFSKHDKHYLRQIAVRTYWFFVDMATKEHHWLIPDHFQEEPASKRYSYGLGVSPTNLGMYLLSLSVARTLGLSAITAFSKRIMNAFKSMERMDRYRGHFFNWYELEEISPLEPKYVSSVDSANLALSLAALRGALKESCETPLLSRAMFEGMDAGLSVLAEACRAALRQNAIGRNERKLFNEVLGAVSESRNLIAREFNSNISPRGSELVYSGIVYHAVRIKNALETLRIKGKGGLFEEVFLAARHIEETAIEYRETVETYCSYAIMPIVSSVTNDRRLRVFYTRLSEILQKVPSVNELALKEKRREIESVGLLEAINLSALSIPDKEHARAWYNEIIARLSGAETVAASIREQLMEAASFCRRYFEEMDFKFLYNKERGLFHVGYNASHERFDDVFYDFLASEANSVSIVGIAKGDVPKRHWGYLGRRLVRSSRGDSVVSSWAGSLFEYLGTLVFFDIPRESFWGISAQRAISAHQYFAKKHRIPWGMGESAFSEQDVLYNYDYQAFGEPSIGFKRNLSESVVVAPYTTALALPFFPNAALNNFRLLAKAGAFGRYGFYDAVDYTGKGKRNPFAGVPVQIYYAHHQGYILSSIANALSSGWVWRMVEKEPELNAITQLFEEKMPDVQPAQVMRPLLPAVPHIFADSEKSEISRRYISMRPKEAHSLFISNGAYHTQITSAGAGMSRYKDINITRSCNDLLSEMQGTFFYIFDRERDALWSPTFMPTKTLGERSGVSAGEQIVSFEKIYEGIESVLRVTVAPDSPVEVRELTITNRRNVPTVLTIGVCADVSLARPREEVGHMNFQRLFVSSELTKDNTTILVSRPDPRDRNYSINAGFLLASSKSLSPLYSVRDRETFWGSPLRRDNPPILRNPERAKTDFPRYTLDTVAGFVAAVTLGPGETRHLAFVSAVGDSRNTVLNILKPFKKYKFVRNIITSADQTGTLLRRELGISSAQAETFAALASLLHVRSRYSAPLVRLEAQPTINALWRCGISGTYPVIVLSVSGVSDLAVIKQMLTCHSYFRRKKIEADIIILNNHAGGYLKTFEDEIDFLLRTQNHNNQQDDTGRVVHVRAEQFGEVGCEALLAASTVYIDVRGGVFADLVRDLAQTHPFKFPPRLNLSGSQKKVDLDTTFKREAYTDISKLDFFNGIGGFDKITDEYVISITPEIRPPAPWSNIVANKDIGFVTTDKGLSFTWARNSYDNKLTVAYNDSLSSDTSEAVYVRDEKSGEYWSPLPIAGDSASRYEIRYGEGYSEYITHQGGLRLRLRMHVAPKEPIKYFTLDIQNNTDTERVLTAFGYFELLMGSFPEATKKHIIFNVRKGNIIIASQQYRNNFVDSRVFLGIAGGADNYTVSKSEFIGRFGNVCAPAALSREGLSSDHEPHGEPAVGFSRRVKLSPGANNTIIFFMGESGSKDALEYFLGRSCDAKSAERSFFKIKARSNSVPKISVELPDRELALLCNRFLLYQTLASRIYARAGFFQIGGSFGFRDQIQDALFLLWHDPKWVRSHILESAAHQFTEGDVLSWWHSYNNFGARTRISDHHLWLPYVVSRYIDFTGDKSVLDEQISYLNGELPGDDEPQSVIGVFHPGRENGSLYEHCVRAVERALTFGKHDLPLIGSADWNDAMNRVGIGGRGESIWLAWFLIVVLRDMAKMAEMRSDTARASRYNEFITRYREAIANFGWDGRWYRRAYTDSGIPVGTASADAFRITSIAQSWAMFADGKTKKVMQALQSAKEELHIWEGHVPLAWPPLNRTTLDLGTISDYPPGVRENGSQYNHAALWLAQALFASGDPDAAKVIIDAVNPFKRSRDFESAMKYRGEPYAVAAEIYSSPTYPGRAGWTWYTASAGALYRTVIEYMFGLQKTGEYLSFSPSFPSDWKEASIKIPLGNSFYIIHYKVVSDKTGDSSIKIFFNGKEAEGGKITLIDDGKEHEVFVYISRPEKTVNNQQKEQKK